MYDNTVMIDDSDCGDFAPVFNPWAEYERMKQQLYSSDEAYSAEQYNERLKIIIQSIGL